MQCIYKSLAHLAWNLPDFTMKSTRFHGLPLNAVFFIHEIQYRNTFRGLGLALNMQCIYKIRNRTFGSWLIWHEIHQISWNPPDFMAMKSAGFHHEIRRIKFAWRKLSWNFSTHLIETIELVMTSQMNMIYHILVYLMNVKRIWVN